MNINYLTARVLTPGLKKFSNLHKAESCYIFGDGPSIKWFDLGLFVDRPAICCGMLPFHNDFHKTHVKYAMLVAPWLFVPKQIQPKLFHGYRAIATEYIRLIKSSPDIEFFVHVSNRFSLSGKNMNYVLRGLPVIRNRTDDLLNHFNLFAGSFHATLTLAYYLGFSKIYLVGFDAWTIQPARTRRWYELGEGEFFEPTDFATEFLNTLKTQVEICTISLDGQSRNVDCVSYTAYTGKSPVFRENYELIDPHHLNVLATYPGNRIYPEPASFTT